MSEPITVIIPGDPHGKQRPRFRANGSTYTPTPTRSLREGRGDIGCGGDARPHGDD